MKRLWISGAALLVLAALCAFGIWNVNHYVDGMQQLLDRASAAADEGDTETAATLAQQADEKWAKAEQTLTFYVNHEQVSQIGLSIARLAPLLRGGDEAGFRSELYVAKVQLIHMYETEVGSFAGLFQGGRS